MCALVFHVWHICHPVPKPPFHTEPGTHIRYMSRLRLVILCFLTPNTPRIQPPLSSFRIPLFLFPSTLPDLPVSFPLNNKPNLLQHYHFKSQNTQITPPPWLTGACLLRRCSINYSNLTSILCHALPISTAALHFDSSLKVVQVVHFFFQEIDCMCCKV